MKRLRVEKLRFENAFSLPDSRAFRQKHKKQTNEKSLFHRVIRASAVFTLLLRANALSSGVVLRFVPAVIGFDDGFAALTHNAARESLFFSLHCSKPNAVQVDPRPHYMRHPPCYMARRAAMAKRKKKAVKAAKKTKKRKKKL
jgi:hypothetical protein